MINSLTQIHENFQLEVSQLNNRIDTLDEKQNSLVNKIQQQQNSLVNLEQQQNDLKSNLERQIVELQTKINTQASLSHISVTNIDSEQTAPSSSIVYPGTVRTSKILKPPTFDGQTAWETYRFQFEAAARANGWNENEMAASLVVSLRGQAATVLQFLPQDAPNYTSLVQALETRYGQQHLKQVFQSQLKVRYQKHNESLQEFEADIKRLLHLAYPQAPRDFLEQIGIQAFIDGLHDIEMQQALRLQHHKTLDKALISAQEYEAAKNISRSLPQLKEIRFTENKQVTTTDNEQLVLSQILSLLQNIQQKPRNENRRCFNCGRMGHLKSNCRSRSQARKEEYKNEIRRSPSSTSRSLSQSLTRNDGRWSLRNRFPTTDHRKEENTLEFEVSHLKEQLAISKNKIERLREQVTILQEECKVIQNNAKTTQSNLENECQKLMKEKNVLNKQVQSQRQLAQKENVTEEVSLRMTTVEQSPKKRDDSNPEMLAQMMELLKELAEDTKEIKNQQKKQAETMNMLTEELKELKEEQKEYRREMGDLKLANEKAIKEINQLQNQLSNTNIRLQKLEGEKRKRNIVI
ncbi:golgin subfamily A member 3-like [Diabrotica virgifera virgifera]|uniref:CCHC-type domain-containing protein n=1 Tax=Diabrotica virgifera virgifera TaxID=50390 RepID=A0ABM5L5F8_DIAVI|nr:golgin subfamily A member 3-like [Diabrotica virgifera virgifera]